MPLLIPLIWATGWCGGTGCCTQTLIRACSLVAMENRLVLAVRNYFRTKSTVQT
jgi:hypothetical protein